MANPRLNTKILLKLSLKLGKSEKYIREQISKKANRKGFSSEAILILWAKENNIGTTHYENALNPSIRNEVRDHLSSAYNQTKNTHAVYLRKNSIYSRGEKENNTWQWIRDHIIAEIIVGIILILISVYILK